MMRVNKKMMGMLGSGLKSGMSNQHVRRGFQAIGTPSIRAAHRGQSLTPQQLQRRGMRRTAIAGGILGANAMVGPRYRSSGRSGYIPPRSTGGYA